MSSKVNRRQVLKKAMAGLLSLAMVVTMVTPASSRVYASALEEEKLATVEAQEEEVPAADSEVTADDPTDVPEAPAAEAEVTEDQAVEVLNPQTLSINDINTIQAVTDMTMYGQGLTEVIITYREGVDVSKVTAANYVLEDRGTLNPDYAKFTIDSVTTEGQTVTLHVSNDTAATANNSIIYSGENAGIRERNALGIYCTGAWYRDVNGQIFYGSEDTAEYKANTLKQGYQARASLELRLRHTAEKEWSSLVDEKGAYDADSLWLPTIDHNFGEGGFITLEEAGINVPSTSASAKDNSGDDYVRGWIYVPDNYDELESVPVVFTLQGQGISYWKLPDGTNNFGTGIMYDATATSWIGKGAIVVNIHDRSSNGVGLGDLQGYNYVLDDVNTMKAVLEKYTKIDRDRIILHGNSRGTMASNTVILALTGQPYKNNQVKDNQTLLYLDKSVYDFDISVYLCHNGTLGGNYWDDAAKEAIAKTGLRVWAFDGQQDTNNVDNVAALIAAYEKAGVKDYDIRLSGYPTNIYAYWGESDHSTTRINFWYFADEPFHGPDVEVVDGQLVYHTELEPGDTYTLPEGWYGKNAGSSKDGYAYTIYEENFEDWALQKNEPEEIADLDDITELPYDFSQAAQLPLTGYFTKTVSEGRTVKVYIPDNASVRSYFTVIAVPDDVDTTAFLEESGWFDIADEEGECLFVLEPGTDGWKDGTAETAYVDAAMSFARGCTNANKVMVFSTFGEFYFVGYGTGAPALERYAAANPILVIAQVYMDSVGMASDALNALGSAVYEGSKAEGSGRETKEEIAEILDGKLLKRSEVAVPTWLINYGTDSKAYWSAANDVLSASYNDDVLGTVYPQNIDSDAYATLYANTRRKAAGEEFGLSLVAVKNADVDYTDPEFTNVLRQYLEDYTRYDTTMAYSNALAERLDYTASLMAAQDAAKDGRVIETLDGGFDIWAFEGAEVPETGATMYTGIAAFADNAKDGDGAADPREFMIYVPKAAQAEGHKAPVVFVYAGNSQTDRIFFDCTQWWKIAEEEGVVLAFPCETYSNNSVSVSHADNTGMYQLMLGMIEKHIDGQLAEIDYSRLYCTGQSAGSAATQTFAQVNPEFFAAVASTSAGSLNAQATGKAIPAYLLHGLGDSNGGYTLFQEENAWRGIFNYYLKADGLGSLADFTADDTAYSYKFLEGTYIADASRYSDTYNFAGEDGIPLVRYTRTSLRPHNCYPEESWLMWNFLKHYSFNVAEDGSVERFYSESAFAKEDSVEILENLAAELQAQVESIDTVTIPNFYGQKVSQVTVTFKEGTDMAAVAKTGLTLYDRGSLDAQFGEVKVSDVKYDGNKAILTIDQGSEKVTDRSRNAFGIYATMSWYIDSEGNIFYGKEDTTDALGMTIHANKTGKGYQARKNLDLILCVGTDITEGLAMTDGVGNLLENTVWNPVVNEGYDDIKTLMVNVGWEADGYTLMGDKGEVPVNVIWPKDYDAKRAEKYPVVFYQCGSGLCYWELTDTTVDGVIAPANNPGCNYAFDNMMTGWAEAYPEAIILSVDVHNTSEVVAAKEVAGVLDYFIANYNVDKDKIVGVGNSYGTFVVSDVIRQRPDLVSAFVENNGNLGTFANQAEVNGTLANSSLKKWTADELKAMIDNQIAVWFINGETDVAHPAVQQDAYTILKREYKAAGMSDAWIDQYLRASGYQSWNFKAWGESDHSCTKITAWYYLKNAYLAPNEDGVALKPGDTYRLAGKEDAQYYGADKFDYTVYAESIAEWAKNAVDRKAEEHLQAEVTDVQYTIVKNFYGYKVGEVTVTFDKDVDEAALAAADFTLYDRGSANPYFGEVKIADVKVNGNVATLTIDQGSDKVTDRSRNTFGALTTTGWYMDTKDNIFFGSEDANDELGNAINPNLTGKSCFPRKNLDLILCVNTTEPKNGIPSTDGLGNLLKNSVWSKITDESGLDQIKLEMVDPGFAAKGYTIVNEMMGTTDKVPVHVIYPEGYDVNRAEKYPVIFYQCGGGVCYWELTDTSVPGVYAPATNLGDNTVYDVMMTKWHEAVPEAIIISVNVHSNLTDSPKEIAGVLDYAIKNWNVDKDKIVGVGNSMGTLITSELIRQRSDLVTAFVECNGNFGGMASADKLDGTLANSSLGQWSADDVKKMIDNEVAVWMFNGETDGDNPAAQQDVIEIVKNLYREDGKSEEWIDSHVRASGLQSWKFKQWGETDHSVTKVVAWNYIENAYTDVNAGQKALKAGDTYHFTGVESSYNKYQYTMDYEYTVYAESAAEWVRNLFSGAYEEPVYTGVEGFVARLYENVLGRTPDAKGLAAWVNQLTTGANGGEEVAKGFIFSDEYIKKNTSNEEFVEMLYNTLLNRKSDAAGKKAWVAQLDSKQVAREEIVEGFIHSNEFSGICEDFGIFATAAEAFASRLYTKCLGRNYDKAGLKDWAELLHNHEISGGNAAKGFFNSDEFQKLNLSDEEFVARCYRTFLNREPDAKGQAEWVALLQKNNTRDSILDGFIGSDEFTALCAQYGIDR